MAVVFLFCGGPVQEKISGDDSGGISGRLRSDAFALADCAGTVYVPDYGNDSCHIAMSYGGWNDRRW